MTDQPQLAVLRLIQEHGFAKPDQAFNREFDAQLDNAVYGLSQVMRHGMPMDIAATCALDQAWWDARKGLHQALDRSDEVAVAFDAWLFTEGTMSAYMPLLRDRYRAEVEHRIQMKAAEYEASLQV